MGAMERVRAEAALEAVVLTTGHRLSETAVLERAVAAAVVVA